MYHFLHLVVVGKYFTVFQLRERTFFHFLLLTHDYTKNKQSIFSGKHILELKVNFHPNLLISSLISKLLLMNEKI